jgi:hypothetical protein
MAFTTFSKASDGSPVSPPPILELSGGFYRFDFDIEAIDDDIIYISDDSGVNVLTGVISLSDSRSITDLVLRDLGLSQENQAIDQALYDTNENLLTARLRTYTNAGSVGSGVNVLATYNITATYLGTALNTYQVVRA